MASHFTRRELPLSLLAAGVLAGSASAATRPLHIAVTDTVARSTCPAGTPSTDSCFSLAGTAVVRGYGRVRVGPLLEREVPPSDPRCGTPQFGTRTLTIAGSTLQLAETWPTLCEGVIGTVNGGFKAVGGTGTFADAMGFGNTTIQALRVGAAETFTGTVAAPTLPPPDTKAPAVRVVSLRVSRPGRLVVTFAAHDAGWPPGLTYELHARGPRVDVSRTGSLPSRGRASVALPTRGARSLRISLRVSDVAANATTITRRWTARSR